MKKLFFLLACVTMSVLCMAQVNQLVWANGRLLYGSPITNVDSLTYDEVAGMDTLLLPRVLIKEVHDTVYVTQIVHDTVYVETDCGGEDDTSAGIGMFSVSADKQVTFSQGNLQYTQSTNTWSFASAQWEMLGTDNVTGGSVSSDQYGLEKTGTALADKVDLFGWSTAATNFGVSTSTDWENGYSGSFVDWGTNQIGSDAPNTWRTLSKDEWMYIFYDRPNAQSLFALGSVNGVNGTIILPDNWTTPADVSFVASTTKGLYWEGGIYYNSNGNNFSHNIYTSEQWSKMEQAGAVFLPASGYRNGKYVATVGNIGDYWSSTEFYESADFVCFSPDYLNPLRTSHRSFGFSVRLAQDL